MVDYDQLREIGFEVYCIGKPHKPTLLASASD